MCQRLHLREWFFLVFLVFALWSCGSGKPDLDEIYLPVDRPLIIEVKGDDYYWHIRYPGRDGQLHTADDVTAIETLFLPEFTTIRIQLHSEDYIYTFAVPDMALNQVAVPELEFSLEFETGASDTLSLRGKQLCGFTHETLHGHIFVEPRSAFAQRLDRHWIGATPVE
tara:strand:+ start:658 stop:1161 length:504 start_codon:yes stop_codon:yes gene_type:complete